MELPAVTRRRSSTPTLSELPETLIHEIVSRLPIKDAGRTSTLSRSWRCRWQSVPNFDLCGFNPNQIYQLLYLHSGCIRLFKANQPKIVSFFPRTPIEWCHSDVCRWISVLSLRSASTLHTLSLSTSADFCWFDASTLARSFPNLTRLHLYGDVHFPHDYKLPALKDLHLDLIDTSYRIPSSIVSCCPVLERLNITFEYRETRMPANLDIVAPNLRWLKVSHVELPDFAVISAPLLESVSFNRCYFNEEAEKVVEGGGEGNGNNGSGLGDCTLTRVLRGMASIKKLELDQHCLMFLGSGLVQDTIPVIFRNLVVVSLCVDLDYLEAISGVLRLLRSTPDLQELNIRAYDYADDQSEELEVVQHGLWEAHEFAVLFNKLETVNLIGIARKEDEICFIRFLLAKAHVLKTVMISFNQSVNDQESIITELLELPKASNQAQILLTG